MAAPRKCEHGCGGVTPRKDASRFCMATDPCRRHAERVGRAERRAKRSSDAQACGGYEELFAREAAALDVLRESKYCTVEDALDALEAVVNPHSFKEHVA